MDNEDTKNEVSAAVGGRVDQLIMRKPCKHGDMACGSGYWVCAKCEDEMHRAAYNRLTPKQKAYDNMVDPLGAYHTDYDRKPVCCSCHISAPCSYCINKDDHDA